MNWKEKRETIIGTYGEDLLKNDFENRNFTVAQWVTEKGHKFDFMVEKEGKFKLIEVKTKPHMTIGKYNGLTGIDYDKWDEYNKVKEELDKPLYLFFVDALHGSIRYGDFDKISHPIQIDGEVYPLDCKHFKEPMTLFHPDQLTIFRELTPDEIEWLKAKSKSRSFM